MSLYGPRLSLPDLPNISIPDLKSMKRPLLAIIALAIVITAILVVGPMVSNAGTGLFSNHTSVGWRNNPLNLTQDGVYEAELLLTLNNNTEELQTITLEVTTDSEELIIFCPYKSFPNVAPGNGRKASCLVRRDPKQSIFSGSYTINIKTNLGETSTILEVVTN